ncbi:hypothetical protein FNV43_RR03536 [Rhamnella rubrinervis]|uniref:Uncharacterized protein n=1 Tax=Rhamnella rubrinervis TaxID=2594499 RepID=A0A8K0HI59_9ROSA|nr:hypothetical protein FNV43_RR03536 [Rhamnella rubrinervis]
MQQYYRLGSLDNCSEKWSALVDCLSLKTKRSSEMQEILESREKENLIYGLSGPGGSII